MNFLFTGIARDACEISIEIRKKLSEIVIKFTDDDGRTDYEGISSSPEFLWATTALTELQTVSNY